YSRKRFDMQLRKFIALPCILTLLLASCNNTNVGKPTPSASNTTESKSANKHGNDTASYGAPSVPEPLDVQGLISDPCSALTDKQSNYFPGKLDDTFTAETTRFSDKETSCAWTFKIDRRSLGTIGGGIPLPQERYKGISSIYKADQQDSYEQFEPLDIAGYPAAINNQTDADDGDCRLSVGLRDDTAY